MNKKPLILIVEDDKEMARLNARLLMRRGYDVLCANSVSEALELAAANAPDLFILDVGLPDGDGVTLCKKLREKSHSPVLFLTGRTTVTDKVTGLRAGGDYYLTKPFDSRELLAVVESLLSRAEQTQSLIADTLVINKGSLSLNLSESMAYVSGKDAGLNQKEFAILLMLAQNEGSELAYEDIYERIWGCDMLGDSGALRQQVSRMKKKLGEESGLDFAIFNEYGKGYTFMQIGSG